MELQLQCLYSSHNNSDIIGFCLNEDCCYQRAYCEICIQNLHINHVKDLCPFNKFDLKLLEANQTLNSLSKQLKEAKEQINKISKFDQQLFSFQQQNFINISHQLLNPAIDQLIATVEDEIKLQNYYKQLLIHFYFYKQSFLSCIKKIEKELIPMLGSISKEFESIILKLQEIQEYKDKQQLCRIQSKIVEPLNIVFLNIIDNIDVFDQGKTAIKKNVGYQFLICEPAIPKQKRVYFIFEILSVGLRTAVGICHKDINTKSQQLKEGHGSYLMVNSGNCFESSKPQGTKTTFEFGKGSRILIEVNTFKKMIIWRNLDNQNEYSVEIDISKELYPCLRLGPKNQNESSSVRILDNYQYTDIEGE